MATLISRRLKKKRSRPRIKERPVNKLFLPDYLTEVRMVAMRGLDDKDIAQTFGVSPELFKKWKRTYPSFKDAIENGRTRADANVLAALYKRATGEFTVPHTEVIKYKDHFETLQMEKHYPPDVDAAKYWLNNRARKHWQQRSSVEASGPGGKPLEMDVNKSELINAIVSLVSPKPDGDEPKSKKAK